MRIGILTRVDGGELAEVERLGFRSVEWMRFADSPAGPPRTDWQGFAEAVAGEAAARGIRISAIAALYRNPMDPKQTESARAVFARAIEVAAHIGVRTVAGFAGGVIETVINERGGNPVYRPFEEGLTGLCGFWEPLARFAAERGVRIAFEHCPQGLYRLPLMGYNALAQPAMWERFFNEMKSENVGIEWDPAHLICQFIDPVANVRKFGSRIFHVHAKDGFIDRDLLETYGICHPGVAEHRFPGLGQADWAGIVRELLRAGYDSDLNIEGWHDPIYRDHGDDEAGPLAGRKLEETGLLIAKRTLEHFVPAEP